MQHFFSDSHAVDDVVVLLLFDAVVLVLYVSKCVEVL